MADGQGGIGLGNINRKNTGTVPKIKYSNNAMINPVNRSSKQQDQSKGSRMSNNLSPAWHHSENRNFIQNKGRNHQRGRYSSEMDVAVEGNVVDAANGVINYSVNNGITPASSSSASTSRRNSIGSLFKCDNVTKYPDRKQIEDKLTQIREYLDVTSTLMTSIRNSDEQIFDIDEKTNLLQTRNDLLDSEQKLSKLLQDIDDNNNNKSSEMEENLQIQNPNNGDTYSENSRSEVELESFDNELSALKDQQLSMLNLKQKSENRLMEARKIQERMSARAQSGNRANLETEKSNKNMSIADFDSAIKELEERTKQLNRNKPVNDKFSADKLLSEMQYLQNQIVSMHDANNEREQIIEVLDNRDSELRTQQAELKKKLVELQTKKDQVDQLVSQLQVMEETNNHSDVGLQVRSIVSMKDQLKNLKDMLEIVNNTTENSSAAEVKAAANEICLTAENLQNEIAKPGHKRNDSFVENRLDNHHGTNETYHKQLNKSQPRNNGAKPKQRTNSINEKIALQSELEAKKRELEEIMGKHKAASSNLNHDVQGSPVHSWKPPIFSQEPTSDDRLSSDADEEEYTEVQDSDSAIFPASRQTNSYYGSNRQNKRSASNRSECDFLTENLQSVSQTPDRVNSVNLRLSEFSRPSIRLTPNNQNLEKQDKKIQKQLELIKSVCDSVLQQIPNNHHHHQQQQSSNNIQQLRNNITVSSNYSEQQQQQQRVSCPPSPFRCNNNNPQNQISVPNIANITDSNNPWFQNDIGNYQNWFTTNNLQTQSFMLNTLNQCCQMLWLQQREMAQLRSTVNMLQERMELYNNPHHQSGNIPIPPSTLPTPSSSYNNPIIQNQIPPINNNNHLHVPSSSSSSNHHQKTNHVSAACSMPNLNQYNQVSNSETMAFTANNNASNNLVPNSALLESCLNNVVVNQQQQQQQQQQQSLLHSSNLNPTQLSAPLWHGQALNNQVPPGNRANNYWDNFRSEIGSHNAAAAASSLDRFNFDRVNPFPILSASKTNSEHSSTNSRENTPKKRSVKVSTQNIENVRNASAESAPPPPPDVLNINQSSSHHNKNNGLEMLEDLNKLFHINHHHHHHQRSKSSLLENAESNNKQEDDQQQQQQRLTKNKLVDELRENVYKEVASLISANEARPHFLIQLFKDLQKIESDALRLKILQSIQTILTQSMSGVQNSQQIREREAAADTTLSELSENLPNNNNWSRPTTASPFSSDLLNIRLEGDEPFLQTSYKQMVFLLDLNDDNIIGNHLLRCIREIFLENDLLKDSVKDMVFLKHFSNVLNDVLDQFRGKKVHDVKQQLLQNMGDLLQGELSFIHLIQETIPENCILQDESSNNIYNIASSSSSSLFDNNNQSIINKKENIQNNDLTEADQSRLEENDGVEDEGAVGGIIIHSLEEDNQILSQEQSEEVLNNVPIIINFPTNNNGEGLDQVPTRLPTKIKSGANTPTKDLLNSRRDSEPY